MREARWLPSPAVEREQAARQRRLARHDALALSGALGLLVVAVLGLIWATVRFSLNAGGFGALLFGFVLSGVGPGVLVDRRRKRLTRELRADDLALCEGFGEGRGWLVDLLILQGAAPSGEDRGLMWVEGDLLYFTGHRTSFALTPDHAAGAARRSEAVTGLSHPWTLPLALRTEAGPVSLSFAMLGETPGESLAHDIARWRETTAVSEGQRPPLARGFGVPSRGRVLLGAVGAMLAWMAALGVARSGEWLMACGIAAFAWGLRPLVRWRAWRDLGRLPE